MSNTIQDIFSAQQVRSIQLRKSTVEERKAKLKKLKTIIAQNESLIYEALADDLRKPLFEAAITEVYFVYGEIDFALKNLSRWMLPKKAPAPLASISTRNRIHYEPKGVSLIISPWNYPFQLLISPLVSAIAAGNCAVLKPSELSPATSKLLFNLINEHFDAAEIACVEGDAEVAQALLALPFDHIFYTGSTQVGKIVMAAAAKHLASVTLELGGKSPVLITESAQLEKAAEKIVWGKFLNAGQTCIAPDYVLLPEHLQEKFIDLLKQKTAKLYQPKGNLDKTVYGKIISQRHFDRLKALTDGAVKQGAKIQMGGDFETADLTISPTVLSGVSLDSELMQEEIFGPVLPIITYRDLEEAVQLINNRPKPLALYIFGSEKVANQVIKNTSAGGTAVNEVLIHISNPHLPFGGIGTSGTGSCHGFYGFKAFSHERSVMYQSAIDFNRMVYPPFNMGLLKWLKKLF
ncbi:MAG: aldehyde dehydrogenase family protein [Sphingobacteriaceae bacterium]